MTAARIVLIDELFISIRRLLKPYCDKGQSLSSVYLMELSDPIDCHFHLITFSVTMSRRNEKNRFGRMNAKVARHFRS